MFSSRFEGLGIVASEVQAARLSTVCSDSASQFASTTELIYYIVFAIIQQEIGEDSRGQDKYK